jgi:uncharacterized membrane protein YhhN
VKQRIEACPEPVEGDAAYPRPLLMATTRTLRYGLRPTQDADLIAFVEVVKMLTAILTLLTLLSAALHLRAEYLGPRYQVYVFKPLTMVFILLIALQARWPGFSRYKVAIVAGLVFSLAGDVFLMLPSDRFIAGLVSFLVAHLFYIAAFTSGTGFGLSWRALPCAIYGFLMFSILLPHLGKMKLPVAVYMVVILVMAWQAWERWHQTGQSAALLAFLGAVLFVISDSALAVNRFRGQYSSAQALILSTYFAAQWLIARSVG